jgi:hypothetical protein
MRLNNKHELKNYLANKRVAVIQKAHHTIHMRVQLTNNRLVDKKILEWNDELSGDVYDPYSTAAITAEIEGYNRIATDKELRRILKHSVITRNPQTQMEATKIISSISDDVTLIEAERMIKNLNYVENVLTNANVDIGKYEALVEKLPQSTSRKEVLERCIMEGKSLPANKRQAFLERALERGHNYKGRQYTYKELNQLSRDLERYKVNRMDYETAIMENRQANREGYANVNETKTWIWSTLEKTRHEAMDGETIPLSAKFEVENSQTGDIDYLLFPGDVANDHNNCSNICNCQCSYEINNA